MLSLPLLILVFSAAYLIGAIPFGYLIAKAKGVDLFKEGSGNIGATNVGRVLGRGYGFLVFGLDLAKGAIPVALVGLFPQPSDLYPGAITVTAGVAAFLGHLFPVYLGFRGGKGVATAAGVILVLMPVPMLVLAVIWIAAFAGTRTVSIASLIVAVLLGVHRPIVLGWDAWDVDHAVVTIFCLLAALFVVIRHAGNLGRIVQGKETAFQESPFMANLARILHVMSVGLWFGTLVCFTAVGYFLFTSMEHLSEKDAPARPYWFRMPDELAKEPPTAKFPDPLRKEQGSRLAGFVISPMFPWFFGVQLLCGAVAFFTSLAWWRTTTGKVRITLLALALALVCFGWILESQISELRKPRNNETDTVINLMSLGAKASIPELQAAVGRAEAARATFGMWHGVSMLANLLTLVLLLPALALAGVLPARTGEMGQQQQIRPSQSSE